VAADTNGHSIGTFLLGVPVLGNTSDISSFSVETSVSNAAGSPAISVAMAGGADLSIVNTDPFVVVSSVNASAIRLGAIAAGSIFTMDYAGQVTASNGNAVNLLALNGSDVNFTFQNTAIVTASGSTSLLGVPLTGGGVVINNVGAGNVSITNHGEFRTQNDAIYILQTGAGTLTVTNDGTMGTQALPIGGTVVNIVGLNAGANAVVNNDNGQMWGTANGVNITVGGTANVSNLKGHIETVNGNAIGVLAGGAVTIDSTTGTTNSTNGGGILAVGGGDVLINSGFVTAGGSGVVGIGPNVTITTHEAISAGGTYGVAGIALGGNSNVTINADVGTPGTGGFSSAIGGNANLTVADAVNISATGLGLGALAVGGDATVTAPNVNVTSGGTGISAIATGGNALITATNATVDAGGIGLTSTAVGGDATINAATANVTSGGVGMLGIAVGGNVAIEAGTVTTTGAGLGSSGVIGVAVGGDTTVNLHGNITTSGGTFGALAASVGGNATVTSDAGITVDPPIGMASVTIGPGTATVNNNATVNSTLVGLLGVNIGTGTVVVNNTGDVEAATGAGVFVLKLGPQGADPGVQINNTGGTINAPNGPGVGVFAFGGVGNEVNVAVNNTNGGTMIGGGGLLSPTIGVLTDGAVTINNNTGALIDNQTGINNANFTGLSIGVLAGGAVQVNNDATLFGDAALVSVNNGVTLNNTANGFWHTQGLNLLLAGGGDATLNNSGLIQTDGITGFVFAGNDTALNNTGTIFANGVTVFAGLNNFNNAGGLLTMQNSTVGGLVQDLTATTGNFNGGVGSRLGIDAALNGPGFNADFLAIGGNLTGATAVSVFDTRFGLPGTYNPADNTLAPGGGGIPFAFVGGTTNSTNFFLANGPIDKGLFQYDVFLRPDNFWVLGSVPDATFFELPSITSAVQQMWHTAAGVWLDRTADLRSALASQCTDYYRGSIKDAPPQCASNVTPGAWARGVGATSSRDQDHSFAMLDKTYTFGINARQDTSGVMGGFDYGRSFNAGNGQRGAWMSGVMAGYMQSSLSFKNSPTSVAMQGGMVGAYLTFLHGGWAVDAKVLGNFGSLDYSNSAPGLVATDSAGYRSIGGVLDVGYRYGLYGSSFVEPGATLTYARTSIDSLSIYGTTVDFQDADSLRGRLGVRVGTSIVSAAHKIEPFVGVSGWYEFDGKNQVSLASGGFNLSTIDNMRGGFGEVSLGLNVFSLQSMGLSGFAKGNYQFNDDGHNLVGQVGVRYNW
jgi:hypothetical protein